MSSIKTINSIEQKFCQSQSGVKYQFSDFVLCTKQNMLIQGDQMIPLNLKAFQCLKLLVTNANKVVLRESFFNHIWNDCFVEDGVLNVNISCLRKILGKNKIKTYSRRGYIFSEQVKVIEDKSYSGETKLTYRDINLIQKEYKSFLTRIRTAVTALFL